MSKKTKKDTVVAVSVSDEQPPYVKELLKKGVVVLIGRSRDELAEMINNIPADCSYCCGNITMDLGSSKYRLQVNLKND